MYAWPVEWIRLTSYNVYKDLWLKIDKSKAIKLFEISMFQFSFNDKTIILIGFLLSLFLPLSLSFWLPCTVAQPPGNLRTDHRTPVAARAALLDGPVSFAAGSEACRVRHTRCWLWWGLSGHLHRRCVSALPHPLSHSLAVSLPYLTVSFLLAARRPRTKTIWEWWGSRTCWMPQRAVAMVRWIPGTVIIGICLALGETAIAMRGGAHSHPLSLSLSHTIKHDFDLW